MSDNRLRIATRKSPLALWQAQFVAERLRKAHPGLLTELVAMTTRGDRMLDAPLAKMGGKGLFVKELEQGMLEDRADIAVHSMKDVPVDFPPGLHLAAILAREDPRDAFVSNRYSSLEEVPAGARIGTSSLRRQCQLKARFPECEVIPLRGNVNSRLSRLDAGEFDAIIVAAAGLKRLGLAGRITETLDPAVSLPAIGQGALGIECRSDDARVNKLVEVLHDAETGLCVSAERAMNERLQGGCQVPIAGFAELENGTLRLRALVGSPDGAFVLRAERSGSSDRAEALGTALAEELLADGADEILKALYA